MEPDNIGELRGGRHEGRDCDDNADNWFFEPFKFMKFELMFDDMLSEEAVQCSPPEEDIENEDGCISFQEGVEESAIDENIDQMLINECQQALVQESESCIEKNANV